MVIQKEIIYPFFLECCKFSIDTFWENVFEDLAYGKSPYGTYINKNFLCCNYKNKEFSYKIERKSPYTLYNDIYILLTKKLGILSHKERIKKRLDFHQTESRIKEFHQEWGNIRKKNIKDLLIQRYVVDMKKKHSLSVKESKYMLSIIFIAIVFKVITTKDIIFENSKIQHIEGIEIINNKIHIKRDIYNLDVDFSHEFINNKKNMSENWEKYLINLRKLKL